MVRLAIFACILLCIFQLKVLADPSTTQAPFTTQAPSDGYDTRTLDIKRAGNGYQVIQYKIKKAANPKRNSPVFYGVGGRVTVDDLIKQYTLFDRQFTDLDTSNTITPTIVYVEQRFFGNSDSSGKVTSYTDFEELTVHNVVQDHIQIIGNLSKELDTKNFLVFGGGHGGLIASYIATAFAQGGKFQDYKVLGWSSSPPIKYIHSTNDFTLPSAFQEINRQLKDLLNRTGGCTSDDDVYKFRILFEGIKNLRSNSDRDVQIRDALILDPLPRLSSTGDPDEVHRDLKELAIYIRNQIISLTFDNNLYDLNSGNTKTRSLKRLCDAIKQIDRPAVRPLVAEKINAVLSVFQPPVTTTKITNWKLRKSDNSLEKSLAASYYQDCTQYRLVYCPGSDSDEVLAGSQWDTTKRCGSIDDYNVVIKAECQGLFDAPGFDLTQDKYKNPYNRSLNNRVITTINSDSIFGKSYDRFNGDVDKEDTSKYSTHWKLNSVDNWEFLDPHKCDSDKVRDVRYLVLRAFGCLAGFIDPKSDSCKSETLFNDNVNGGDYDDSLKFGNCGHEDDPEKSKFPFGHAKVNIINPGNPIPASSSSTGSPPTPVTGSTWSSTTSGVNSFFSSAFILFSSFFLWSTAGALL